MNYDCELIRDIAPLYRDGALSEGGKKIVEEHLAQCAVCREYYADEDDRTLPALPHDSETQEIALLSKKLKKRRLYQVGMFAAVLALLFFLLPPWFGYPGVAEIAGLVILSHPLALAGLACILFAVWYPFAHSSRRIACGYTGFFFLLGMELLEFLTIPLGSTAGLQLSFFCYDIPRFTGISLVQSVSYALPGFYLGLFATVAAAVLFFFFTRKMGISQIL